jgi:clan AA aspartic protease
MENGFVTADRTIVIPVEVLYDQNDSLSINAIIDTGFDGDLTLPGEVFNSLRATKSGTRQMELADGSLVEMGSYLMEVNWFGHARDVVAIESESEPLLGMSLLWGSRVRIDGGDVAIEQLV